MYQASDTFADRSIGVDKCCPSSSDAVEPKILRCLRDQKGESQEEFWIRFGVSQSSGSRYEAGAPLPQTLAILMRLYAGGKLTDEMIKAAS